MARCERCQYSSTQWSGCQNRCSSSLRRLYHYFNFINTAADIDCLTLPFRTPIFAASQTPAPPTLPTLPGARLSRPRAGSGACWPPPTPSPSPILPGARFFLGLPGGPRAGPGASARASMRVHAQRGRTELPTNTSTLGQHWSLPPVR